MKHLLFLFLFYISTNSNAQTIEKDQIIGNWKVENATCISTDKNLKKFTKSFINSIFTFQTNHDFIFITNDQNQVMQMFVQKVKNSKWLYDNKKKLYKIGNNVDRFSIMAFRVKIENNKAFLTIDETDLKLELVRIK